MQEAVIILQLVLHTGACLKMSSGCPKWPCTTDRRAAVLDELPGLLSLLVNHQSLHHTADSDSRRLHIVALPRHLPSPHGSSLCFSEAEPQLRPELADLVEVTGLAKGFDHGPVDRSRDVPERSAGTHMTTPPLALDLGL